MKILEKYLESDDLYMDLVDRFQNEFYCFRCDQYKLNHSYIAVFCCDVDHRDTVGIIFRYSDNHLTVQVMEEVTENLTGKVIQFLNDTE